MLNIYLQKVEVSGIMFFSKYDIEVITKGTNGKDKMTKPAILK